MGRSGPDDLDRQLFRLFALAAVGVVTVTGAVLVGGGCLLVWLAHRLPLISGP